MRPYFPGGELNDFSSTLHIHIRICNTLLAAFTARTTRVSNPDCSPSFRPSQSDPFWLSAFATGSLPRIIAFYRSPRNTPNPSRSLVEQSLLPAVRLSPTISQEIYPTCYERFRPNNHGPHLWRRDYRGCWHRSYPPLILREFYSQKKPILSIGTWNPLITLACSVKVSRLLHPVGLGPVSQCPSRGYLFQGPYGSMPWWAITPPTS